MFKYLLAVVTGLTIAALADGVLAGGAGCTKQLNARAQSTEQPAIPPAAPVTNDERPG
jgi:hypothetical protein